jgi:hypothetical protein
MKRVFITNLIALILTAGLGRITYQGHTETWYNLPMQNVVQRAQDMGIPAEYSVRDDGVKMFGPWVIVAAHPSKIRYTLVDTSLGQGVILDTHEMLDEELIDIAVEW